MAYRWQYQDPAGGTIPGPDAEFAEQGEAEDWLGEHWQALLAAGVDRVTLVDGEREVYGPMSLRAPDE